MKKTKFITKAKRLLSGIVATAIAASMLPTLPAMAEETTEKYPYALFAGSSEEGAITVNAGNFCVNGNVATNGTIVSSGNMNINGTRTENANESMIFIFDKIDSQYFSTGNVDEFTEDYTLEEINININTPTEVMGETTLTGNININTALKSLEDVNLYGEVKNTNNSVIFSQYGDIIIDSQNVNLNGLIYAPYGTVDITSQNLNLNNVIIIAERIVLSCPNVNVNYSNDIADFVGVISENERRIIVNKSHLTNSSDGAYILNSDFTTLDGYLGKAETINNFQCSIYDKNDTLIFNQIIKVQPTWDINEIGLINGYNKIIFEAEDVNGIVYNSEIRIVAKTSKYMENLQIDTSDNDGDGLWNYFETYFETDMNNDDTDDDGLSDFLEIYTLNYDPNKMDTDGNNVYDGDEDCDEDGLPNILEIDLNSNPISVDTDNDKLIDNIELDLGTFLDDEDTDKDGITDYEEYVAGFDPLTFNTLNEVITKNFDITELNEPYDKNVYPTIKLRADIEGISTFNMNVCEHNELINSSIPGYIGSAYSFTLEGNMLEAELTFIINDEWYDTMLKNDSSFLPTIYYYNETTSMLEEVPEQIRVDNKVSATLSHFSTYLLLNKNDVEAFWNETIPDYEVETKITKQIVFLLDTSSSMDSNDPNYIRANLVNEFADRMDENTSIAVMSFDNYTKTFTKSGFTDNKSIIEEAINNFIEYGNPGGTYIYRGLQEANNLFTTYSNTTDEQTVKSIFLLTDGYSFDTPTTDFLTNMNENGISVYTVGLGSVDENYLRRISDATGGQYFYARVDKDLEEVFLDFEKSIDNVDLNNDGIDDYLAYLMCIGDLKTHTGADVLTGIDYDNFQNDADGDWDNDGLKNGEEIEIFEEDGKPYVAFLSYPTIYDSDFDGYSDGEEITNGTQNNTESFVISRDDYSFLTNDFNYLSYKAAQEYIGDGGFIDTAGICLERFFDVLMCGGEISLEKRVEEILMEYMIDYSEFGIEELEVGEYIDTFANSINCVHLFAVDCGTSLADATYGQQLRESISAFQKEMNTFRKSADKATHEGTEHYREMQLFLRDMKKDLKDYDQKIEKFKKHGSSIAKTAEITFVALNVLDDIGGVIQYNCNLKQLSNCKFVLEDLQNCGFSEIEIASCNLLNDINSTTTVIPIKSLVIDYGADIVLDKVTESVAKWGKGGLIATVVLAVGGLVFGESLGADLENSISYNIATSISLIGSNVIDEKTELTTNSSGNLLMLCNYSWNCESVREYLCCIISTRKFSEQRYLDIITEKNWFIDKGRFVYKTETSEEEANNNIAKLEELIARYCIQY